MLSWRKIWAAPLLCATSFYRHYHICPIIFYNPWFGYEASSFCRSSAWGHMSSLGPVHEDMWEHPSFARHFFQGWASILLLRFPWDTTNAYAKWTYNKVTIFDPQILHTLVFLGLFELLTRTNFHVSNSCWWRATIVARVMVDFKIYRVDPWAIPSLRVPSPTIKNLCITMNPKIMTILSP